MTAGRFNYRAFGLGISSDFELCEADHDAPGETALRVREVRVPTPSPAPEGFRDFRVTPQGDLLTFRGVGRFLLRGGGAIDVDLEPAFDRRLVGLPLLGPVLALLLHRRDLLVLHGSAVLIDGKAHVFIGDKGAGKSTTAAALVATGFRLVSDDVVAIERLASGMLVVRPGFPAMKLDAETLARFERGSYRVLAPDGGAYTTGKLRVRLRDPGPKKPVPLGTVHCLARGAMNALDPLATERKLHALIRFSHFPRLGPAANEPEEAARLFCLATRLALEIHADVLTVRHGLAELSDLGSFLVPETSNARRSA